MIELDNSSFKLWYTKKLRSKYKLGIIVDNECRKDIMDVKRVGDWTIILKFVVEQYTLNPISAYAAQVGLA